jgi:predicted Zn-dependent protease
LAACGEEPRFGPFYAARAQVCEDNVAGDLQKAARLDPGQWRYGAMLARHCLKQGDSASALAAAADYARRFPANDILALLHAKALLSNTRYQAAADLLSSLNLLPCEGSTEARSLFREAHLMLAVARLKSGAFAEARPLIQKAREWPEHLGAGKPYPEDVDERLEDWLAYQCELKSNAPSQPRQILDRLLAWRSPSHARDVGEVIRALALRESGQSSEAQQLLEDWQKDELAGEVANWGLEVLAGRSASLSSKRQNADSRVLSAWLESVRVP